MNTTTRISKRLFDLKQKQFDAATAVAEKLEQSEEARITLAEKVSVAVNVKKDKSKYSGLTPVNVDPEALLTECAPQRAPLSAKSGRPPPKEPDIMQFFSEAFEEEMANFDFAVLGEEEPLPCPSPPPLSHAFDLYNHIKCWQPLARDSSR